MALSGEPFLYPTIYNIVMSVSGIIFNLIFLYGIYVFSGIKSIFVVKDSGFSENDQIIREKVVILPPK